MATSSVQVGQVVTAMFHNAHIRAAMVDTHLRNVIHTKKPGVKTFPLGCLEVILIGYTSTAKGIDKLGNMYPKRLYNATATATYAKADADIAPAITALAQDTHAFRVIYMRAMNYAAMLNKPNRR
jgi:hypothetical protein